MRATGRVISTIYITYSRHATPVYFDIEVITRGQNAVCFLQYTKQISHVSYISNYTSANAEIYTLCLSSPGISSSNSSEAVFIAVFLAPAQEEIK